MSGFDPLLSAPAMWFLGVDALAILAVYAAALRPRTPITGAFVAMSVYKPAEYPPVANAKGRPFYILHSPQDAMIPMNAPRAFGSGCGDRSPVR